MYDFNRCKLCGKTATIHYKLKKMNVYGCDTCGFHYTDCLDAMPSESQTKDQKALDRKGWEYIEAMLPGNREQQLANLQLVKAHCRLSGASCLDIGAGAGVFLDLLSREGASVHGIEPQKAFREFVLEKFGIVLKKETVDDAVWQNSFSGSFDLVTLWDVIEHINFPSETLEAAFRLIKRGGLLFLDTPCRNSISYRLGEWSYNLSGGKSGSLLETFYSPLPFRHKQIFTLNQLVQLVQKAGFTVVHVNSSLFVPQNKILMICRKESGEL